MKKISKIWLIILSLCLISGCAKDIDEAIEPININDTLNKFCNQETFILTITSSDCDNCEQFKNIEDRSLKATKLMSYSLNYDNLNTDDIKNLYKYVTKVEVLPSVYYVVNGSVVAKFNYSGDDEKWKKWLRKIKTTQT